MAIKLFLRFVLGVFGVVVFKYYGYKDFYKVYTDASKTQDGVEISIILKNQHILFKLSNTCSIFRSEATAILGAIKTIIKE